MAKAKVDYVKVSQDILALIGGKENLSNVSHCFTRLRLDLVDVEKADIEALKKVEGTTGCVVNNGQIQVIIGTNIEECFKAFTNTAGINSAETSEITKDENIVNRILNGIAKIFIPVFPAIAAGGLLKGILIALLFSGKVDPSGGTFTLLMMFSDAAFYFLPVFLAYSSAKVFGCKPMVAAVLAGVLLHPTYTGLAEATTFLGMKVPVVDYSSTVFPIIIGVAILAVIEKGCKKVMPKAIAGLVNPLICILVTAPIMLIAVGPVINTLSNTIGNGVIALYDATGAFGGAVFGAVYPFLVFTGLHHAVVPVELQSLATLGYDPLLALCAAANAAVGGAALMVAVDSKSKEFKALSASSAVSALIGTTEPALYGVLGILKRPFIGACAGGAAGAAIMAATKVYGAGLGPVPGAGIAMFIGDKFGFYLIGVAVSIIVAMVVTHFVKFQDVTEE